MGAIARKPVAPSALAKLAQHFVAGKHHAGISRWSPAKWANVRGVLKTPQEMLAFYADIFSSHPVVSLEIKPNAYLAKRQIELLIKATRKELNRIFQDTAGLIHDRGFEIAIHPSSQLTLGIKGNNCCGRVLVSDENRYFVILHKGGIWAAFGWDRKTNQRCHTEYRGYGNAEVKKIDFPFELIASEYQKQAEAMASEKKEFAYLRSMLMYFEQDLREYVAVSQYGIDLKSRDHWVAPMATPNWHAYEMHPNISSAAIEARRAQLEAEGILGQVWIGSGHILIKSHYKEFIKELFDGIPYLGDTEYPPIWEIGF